MKKIVDWINMHKVLTICITLFLFIVQPIVVHWMFKTPAATTFWVKTWEAGDLLGYIAGFEAFLGTVFLGVVAARQNDKANEINNRLVDIEVKQSEFDRQPHFSIGVKESEYLTVNSIYNRSGPTFYSKAVCEIIDYTPEFWNREFFYFSFPFKNISSYNITFRLNKLELFNAGDESSRIKYELDPFSLHSEAYLVFPDQEVDLGFIVDKERLSENHIILGHIRLEIANCTQEMYMYKLSFIIVSLLNNKFGIFRNSQEFDKIDKNPRKQQSVNL